MKIGIRRSLFKQEYDTFGFVCEETWVKYLMKVIYDFGIQIDNDLEDVELTRKNDTTLASVFKISYSEELIIKGEWGRK